MFEKFKRLNQNTKTILSNTAAAFAIKGLSLIISLLTTPAFIRYFGNNTVLGVWYTLLSVLSWFLTFDLGIGNGIRNRLVKDLSDQDFVQARKTISSGMFSSGAVALLLTAIGCSLLAFIDLHKLFNVSPELISTRILTLSSVFVLLAIILRFFLTTVSSIFYALQKSSVNNFLSLIVSILLLVFVTSFRCSSPEQGLLALSIAYLVLANLPLVIAGIVIFSTSLKKCRPSIKLVNQTSLKQIMGIGTVFFACQIFYMIIMNTNSFLITNRYGAEFTTEYEFYYRLTSLVSMIISLAITPIWSMVTKATHEKDYSWLCRLYRIMKLAGLTAVLFQFLLIPFEQSIMDLWLGENSIPVRTSTAISFACFGSVFVYSSILSTIVCGMARMKLQAIMYGIGSAAKLILVFALSRVIQNWELVVWSNVLVLLPYCIAQQIDLDSHLKKLRESE